MEFDGDKARTIFAMITARVWRDSDYRIRFLADPKAVLAEEGITFPDDVTVRVVEDTSTVKYVNLAREAESQQDAEKLIPLIARFLPIPPGHEVRLVQSSDKTRYLVIPPVPANVGPSGMSEMELMRLSADSGVEATYHDTSQSVEAESTEVTVTETSEVQDAETSTTVVAEAELVAT